VHYLLFHGFVYVTRVETLSVHNLLVHGFVYLTRV